MNLKQKKKQRLAKIEKERIEIEKKKREVERLRAIQEEEKRKKKIIYDRYINNPLRTGSTPYYYCFGGNNSCNYNYCSKIKVITPSNSDVLVTIKKYGKVYRHAYIKANSSYIFEIPKRLPIRSRNT